MALAASSAHSRLVDEVCRTLEEQILSGELRPGDRLTVVPLAQRFGTSQSTVREALLTLERHGLVRARPRHGVTVVRLTERESSELLRMRALVEGYAATLGAANITDGLLGDMERLIIAMRKCTLPRYLPRLIQLDQEYHRHIAELARSNSLIEVWSGMSGRIGALIMRSVETNQLTLVDVERLHQEVLDALATRNPVICRNAVITHYLPDDELLELQLQAIQSAVNPLVPAEMLVEAV